MKNLFIIAPLSSLSRRTRLFKLAKYTLNLDKDINIIHVSWERNPGESVETQLDGSLIEKTILQKGGGMGGSKVKIMYIFWMLKVFFYAFKIPRGSTVWALGFESAFPALLASKIKGYNLYFDDADRFSMLFKWPRLIKSILGFFERFTSRNVYRHIVPGMSRYDFESGKFFILKNMPSKSELIQAKKIYEENEWPKSKIVINVNGWLDEGRGIQTALKISKHFKEDQVHIILAGRLVCKAAEQLSEQDNVTYLGFVSNAHALASYFASDIVFTYFSPTDEVNLYAESNKWGDAIKTGCAIFVNSEVKSAQYLRDHDAALSLGYSNHAELINKIQAMLESPEKLYKLKKNVIAMESSYPFFEDQLSECLGVAVLS